MTTTRSDSVRAPLAWALALFVLTSIAGLGVRPLAVPDEARYGAIASEMVERQDWIALRLGGFHWLEKPPLAIWGIAASTSVLGENVFAIRLPSVIGMLLGALAAGWVAARATRRPELVAATVAVQATMVGPLIFGTVAITDGAFAGTLALTMAAWFGACTTRGGARIAWLVAAGVGAGLAELRDRAVVAHALGLSLLRDIGADFVEDDVGLERRLGNERAVLEGLHVRGRVIDLELDLVAHLHLRDVDFDRERARVFLRGEVARRVDLRHAPELHFELDRSFDEGAKLETLLRSDPVRRDLG